MTLLEDPDSSFKAEPHWNISAVLVPGIPKEKVSMDICWRTVDSWEGLGLTLQVVNCLPCSWDWDLSRCEHPEIWACLGDIIIRAIKVCSIGCSGQWRHRLSHITLVHSTSSLSHLHMGKRLPNLGDSMLSLPTVRERPPEWPGHFYLNGGINLKWRKLNKSSDFLCSGQDPFRFDTEPLERRRRKCGEGPEGKENSEGKTVGPAAGETDPRNWFSSGMRQSWMYP